MARYEFRSPGFGGGGFGSLFPPVIKWLLILNVGIFFLEATVFNSLGLTGKISDLFALHPVGSGDFWPWQLISYQFLHAGLSHVFFNMLALWMFGMEIESELGSKRFLIYYLLCGAGGGLLHSVVSGLMGSEAPTIGASGSIYGVLVAFAMIYPDRPIFMFPFFVPIQARFLIMIYIAIDLISLFTSRNSGVAYLAHLGGGFIGFALLKFGMNGGSFSLGSKLSGLFSRKKVQPGSYSGNLRVVPTVKEAEYRPARASRELFSFEGEDITQAQVDEILDKISQSGYQSLTEREKKILNEVSKRM